MPFLLLVGLVLWVYALVDVITTDDSAARHLPKVAWVFVVLLFPLVGSLAWLALGRPASPLTRPPGRPAPRRRPAPPRASEPRPPLGPEDSPDWPRWANGHRRDEDDPTIS